MKLFVYKGLCVNVVDGDTIDILIDLGFGVYTKQRLRLARIDTPELNSSSEEERGKAKVSKQYVIDTALNKEVIINTTSKDKYGRYIAEVFIEDVNLSDLLLSLEYAVVYK